MSFITNLFESDNLPMEMLAFNTDNICIQVNDAYSKIPDYPAVKLLKN